MCCFSMIRLRTAYANTLIDNIFTNISSYWSNEVVYNDLSGYAAVFVSVQRMAGDAETDCKHNTFVCTNA